MSVGQSLAAARAESGLSIEALSASTRIRGTLIRAIEADDFSMCGGDVYARGHIRSIARVLGVDDAPLLAEFDTIHPRETIDHTVESIGNEWRPLSTRDRSKPAWGKAMVAAVLIGVCTIVIVGLVKKPAAPGPTVAPITGTGSTAATVLPSQTALVTPTPVVTATTGAPVPSESSTDIAKAPVDGVNLRLRVTGDQCWISVTDATGKQLAQTTLHNGDVRDFRDPTELRLVIGNAGALTIIYNGKDLPPLGGKGAVVHRTFKATVATASAG